MYVLGLKEGEMYTETAIRVIKSVSFEDYFLIIPEIFVVAKIVH